MLHSWVFAVRSALNHYIVALRQLCRSMFLPVRFDSTKSLRSPYTSLRASWKLNASCRRHDRARRPQDRRDLTTREQKPFISWREHMRKYEKIKNIRDIWESVAKTNVTNKADSSCLKGNWLKVCSTSETSGGTIHVAQKIIPIWFLNIICEHDKMRVRSNQFSIWIAASCLTGFLFQDLFERPICSCLSWSWGRDYWNTPDWFFSHL